MAQLDEFKDMIADVTAALEINLICMREVAGLLPELPAGAEYLQLNSLEYAFLAPLSLNIMTSGRAIAVEVMRLMHPLPLHYNPQFVPCFQPLSAPAAGFMPIFPAVYYAQYAENNPDDVRHHSQLVWFHPMRISGSPKRLMIVAHINDDPGRVYPEETIGMPEGVLRSEPGMINGFRTATVHWDSELQLEEWYDSFVHAVSEDVWADEIG